jgi:hypothetical protein
MFPTTLPRTTRRSGRAWRRCCVIWPAFPTSWHGARSSWSVDIGPRTDGRHRVGSDADATIGGIADRLVAGRPELAKLTTPLAGAAAAACRSFARGGREAASGAPARPRTPHRAAARAEGIDRPVPELIAGTEAEVATVRAAIDRAVARIGETRPEGAYQRMLLHLPARSVTDSVRSISDGGRPLSVGAAGPSADSTAGSWDAAARRCRPSSGTWRTAVRELSPPTSGRPQTAPDGTADQMRRTAGAAALNRTCRPVRCGLRGRRLGWHSHSATTSSPTYAPACGPGRRPARHACARWKPAGARPCPNDANAAAWHPI